jgi:hypothetical protein
MAAFGTPVRLYVKVPDTWTLRLLAAAVVMHCISSVGQVVGSGLGVGFGVGSGTAVGVGVGVENSMGLAIVGEATREMQLDTMRNNARQPNSLILIKTLTYHLFCVIF